MPVMQLQDMLLFGIPVALSTTTLAALHWYPWNKGMRPLKRLAAYAVGTAVVVGYPVVAMLAAIALQMPQAELFWASLLLVNTAASGATVHVAYWIDGAKAITAEDTNNAARDL